MKKESKDILCQEICKLFNVDALKINDKSL